MRGPSLSSYWESLYSDKSFLEYLEYRLIKVQYMVSLLVTSLMYWAHGVLDLSTNSQTWKNESSVRPSCSWIILEMHFCCIVCTRSHNGEHASQLACIWSGCLPFTSNSNLMHETCMGFLYNMADIKRDCRLSSLQGMAHQSFSPEKPQSLAHVTTLVFNGFYQMW